MSDLTEWERTVKLARATFGKYGMHSPPWVEGVEEAVNHIAQLEQRNSERLEEACDQLRKLGFSTGHGDTFESILFEQIANLRSCRERIAQLEQRIAAADEALDTIADLSVTNDGATNKSRLQRAITLATSTPRATREGEDDHKNL